MLQTHQQLKTISDEYNSLFTENEYYPLQKAYTTPHFLVLSIRFPGKSVVLYIGRGNQYQGIFLANKIPPSYLRVQDRLLDYVRKYLVGARIGKLEFETKSMVNYFHFKNDHIENTFLIGYKERQLFFARQSKEESYLSWSGEILQTSDLLSIVRHFGADKIASSTSQTTWTIDEYLKEEEKKISGRPIQRKKEIFLKRKIKNITDDLNNVKNWKLLQDDLNENRLDLNLDELKIYGQRIKLQGLGNAWLKKDAIFKKIKKLKRGEEILTQRLESSILENENVKRGDFNFEITREKVIQPLWITHQKQVKPNATSCHIKEFKLKSLSGIIGLDARSNDWIRAQASKEHYWFHVENYTGSHCIIKTDDFSKLSFDDLGAIASLLRDYSKLEILEIPVLYTQLKNVKGIKGSAGKVIVKKAKHLRCLYKDWKEIITIF